MGIELNPADSFNFVVGCSKTFSFSIGPVRCNGIQGISDGKNPRFQRNFFPFEAVRIPSSVIAFMMEEDHSRRFLQKQEFLNHLITQKGMFFDDFSLFIRQSSWLPEDGAGNPNLSDIMEQCASLDLDGECSVIYPKRSGQKKRVSSDKLGVSDGVFIAICRSNQIQQIGVKIRSVPQKKFVRDVRKFLVG